MKHLPFDRIEGLLVIKFIICTQGSAHGPKLNNNTLEAPAFCQDCRTVAQFMINTLGLAHGPMVILGAPPIWQN
jgi:hypothetical protein